MDEIKTDQERKESPTQRAWKALYNTISADANARQLPADRLRYRQDIDYRGFSETGANYDIRVSCYAVDDMGRPRVVVADVYEDDVHIQQVFSEGAWRDNGLGIRLTPSIVDKSYVKLTALEVGIYAAEVIKNSLEEDAEESAISASEVTPGETIFPVPSPKSGDAPN